MLPQEMVFNSPSPLSWVSESLCGSRKYPYHPHGGDLPYDTPSLWIFQYWPPPPNLPPSPPEFQEFLHTLWKYCYLLLKWTNKKFCSLGYGPNLVVSYIFWKKATLEVKNKRSGPRCGIRQSEYWISFYQICIFEFVVKLRVADFIHVKIVMQSLMCWKRHE